MAQSIRLPNIGYLEQSTAPQKGEPYQEFMIEALLNNHQTLTRWENESTDHTAYAMPPARGYYESMINELMRNFATFFWHQKH